MAPAYETTEEGTSMGNRPVIGVRTTNRRKKTKPLAEITDLTYIIRRKSAVGEPSGGCMTGEILAVRREVPLEDRLQVVVVPGINGGVAKHEEGRYRVVEKPLLGNG